MSATHLDGDLTTVASVAATLVCYRFAVSPAVRALSLRPEARRWGIAVAAVAASAALPTFAELPRWGALSWLVAFAVALITWRCATSDYDVTQSVAPQRRDKRILLLLGAGSCLWPPVMLLWLGICCGRLRSWQHHAMMPLRLTKAYLSWFLANTLIGFAAAPEAEAGLLLVLGCVSLSHYVKPAWSKARLGPRPWSWAWHNRTHYLMASAYCWGWARFLRGETVSGVLRRVRVLDRPLNLLTTAVEAAGLIAFLDRRLLVASLTATVLFGAAVAVASGIFFWESICTNAAFAVTVASLPETVAGPAFGWQAMAVALAILVLSSADLLWQPWHLGWWDSPFTGRVHWQVETVSGAKHGLYNDFMCPYEREFGRVLGYFLTKEPVLHGHLGIVWDRRLRDEVLASDGDREALRVLKQAHGQVHWNEAEAAGHIAFLTTMFTRLNAGAPKGPLSGRWRRLKAPDGQIYRWGDLPAYRGDEPVRRITVRYQERCYRPAANEFLLVTDSVLRQIELPEPTHHDNGWSTSCAKSSSTAAPTSESS